MRKVRKGKKNTTPARSAVAAAAGQAHPPRRARRKVPLFSREVS